MFSLVRTSIVSKLATRSFASSSLYIGNLSPSTTEASIKSAFGEFGKITAVNMNTGRNDYRYAHVYYGAGDVPMVGGSPQFSHGFNPTPEEIETVRSAVFNALNQRQTYNLDGNDIVVRKAINRVNGETANQGRSVSAEKAFQDGYSTGYRQGVADGKKMN
ncbi:hypothetical protein LPJ77_006069 [Coemansia sp. RSA 2523]|nr:hypothetical protein LPJ54_003514 [Coemansia sp. RSA 1824]KAJ1801149.1 hypothetical protein LPJ77_006069 [Coemansia sp. RSA 2523]KAJ2141474.1 hypothetical protein J3F82_005509 [Coemansia sp. RSA 637]KAJ2146622.1 hypothetical protein IW142_002005 [Coemansia sp. RSA 564]KAJ2169254.1 hypothetical protein GGH15_000663 [Coemansia sp. RSA 562]KAJ2172360.1 hypothetical protein GGH16_002382 [Coemansia sp. RSA 560]KAJ2190240.1 hypothetical protein EV181_001140 [Coemansia sp. RSA 532]KAJ2202323.1 h